jgi:hypothetical protein
MSASPFHLHDLYVSFSRVFCLAASRLVREIGLRAAVLVAFLCFLQVWSWPKAAMQTVSPNVCVDRLNRQRKTGRAEGVQRT